MAYLNNSSVIVDAILTKKGRELLARNDGSFRITQFSVSDDEIDYTLYNPNHPSGSAFYGEAIENMPVIQAFPNDTEIMKYKLITLPRGTAKLPVVSLGYENIVLKQGSSLSITPQTLNYLGANSTFEQSGYVATIGDVRTLNAFNGVGINTPEATSLNATSTIGTNVSKTVIGTSINLTATTVNTLFGTNNVLYTTLIVTGRDSGARISVPVQIKKTN
ncbi:MAG: hypothetical protein EBZ69_05940 [Alphaproteobacteria bacterium]|nr:hypothetical protein [Alphaproteobacteria bacterium]